MEKSDLLPDLSVEAQTVLTGLYRCTRGSGMLVRAGQGDRADPQALHDISKGVFGDGGKIPQLYLPPLPLSFTKRCMTKVHTCNNLED